MVVTLPHLKHRVTEEADLVRPGAVWGVRNWAPACPEEAFQMAVLSVISASCFCELRPRGLMEERHGLHPPVSSVVGARSTLGSTTFKSRIL